MTNSQFRFLSILPFFCSVFGVRCSMFDVGVPPSNSALRVTHSALRSISYLLASVLFTTGCASISMQHSGTPEKRVGDEIVVAGRFFHTGTPVVLWMDPGGYDAYRVERRFSPLARADWKDSTEDVHALTTPNRFGLRRAGLSTNDLERVRGGGWDLPTLQQVVDQFVIHYDDCGVSRQCFKILQDYRDLSVHFMLDIDGTIYQTLDLKERAYHATIANDRSVGIEIASMGARGAHEQSPLDEWYHTDAKGKTAITIPANLGDGGVRTPNFVGHPDRPGLIHGNIQGEDLEQYDYTPQQYAALIKLTATLCQVFPKITCDYPKDADGRLITHKLPDDQLKNYHGILGHYHVQTNKTDPGPAFQFDTVINGARQIIHPGK